MSQLVRTLIVEDVATDAELMARALNAGGMKVEWRRVDSDVDMRAALRREQWDVILCDHNLPSFSSRDALKVATQLAFDGPFIIVSGAPGEALAVEAMKMGVDDYILKDDLTRLVPSLERALREAESRRDRRRTEQLAAGYAADLQVEKELRAQMDRFLSIAAHEIRTPLTGILGFTELLLLRDIDKETIVQWVGRVHAETKRLTSIVDELLDFSKVHAGRLQLNPVPVDLAETIETVVASSEQARKTHIIHVELPNPLPLAMADEGKLVQVLINLIDNAVKYSPGADSVEVTARDDNGTITIGVTDHGLGIKPEDQPRIFQSFERLEQHAKIKGTGLGLYLVKSFLVLMNGEIWVESEEGQGSTFYFTLPACLAPEPSSGPLLESVA